jgi:hypothetical protein
MLTTHKVLLAAALATFATSATSKDIYPEFVRPPASARPLVWWHWLNGNVSLGGIDRDLEWMQRIGIGGFQMFDGSLGTPQIVDKPKLFMTPEWREAVRHAAKKASQLRLEMSIATSAGWSAAGGPWVSADDAMKKLVWSTTYVNDQLKTSITLPQPPRVAGPFQEVAGGAKGVPPYYRDVAVLAYPEPETDLPLPKPSVRFSSEGLDAETLLAGNLAKPQSLPFIAEDRAWVKYAYEQPQTIRSVTVGLPTRTGFGAPAPAMAELQRSDSGDTWTTIATLPPSTSAQRTVTFAAVTARMFRLVLGAAPTDSSTALPQPAPGVIGPPFPPSDRTYPLASFSLHGGARVNHFEEKAGFAVTRDYYAVNTIEGSSGIAKAMVLDITSKMDEQGNLDWHPPPGRWRILRLGYSLTGHQNGPAIAQGTGLEVDKLSAAPVRRYLEHYLQLYRDSLGDQRKVLTGLLADSIESGPQNWTPDMLQQFQRLRGYDPLPWLPALTGTIIENATASDRFLWDWRRTISQLLESQYYQTVAQLAHEQDLELYSEALEDNRPQLGDDIGMRSRADVPMGALWALAPGSEGRPTYLADVLGAASTAHLYGQDRVGAEAFGAFLQPWAFSPRDLKRTADLALSLGVNLFNIHTSAHQPLERKPGLALAPFLGQYFSRHETWAESAKPWIDYLARSSYLLQQGHHVADVLYFYGEEAPLTSLYGQGLPSDLPTAYGFDFINADALKALVTVRDGQLKTASKQSYRLLYLGGSSRYMTLSTLEKIHDLVKSGAIVVGARPLRSPSQSDDSARFQALAADLWPSDKSSPDGPGRVLIGMTPEQALAHLGIQPDLRLENASAGSDIRFQHRRMIDGSEIYFIANLSDRTERLGASFRVTALKPALWDADRGNIQGVPSTADAEATRLDLELTPGDAKFVVFRKSAMTAPALGIQSDRDELKSPWHFNYDDVTGKNQKQTLMTLSDWAQSPEPSLKYFSGTATYSQRFFSSKKCSTPCYLDLGDVRDLAEVNLNSYDLGTLWKPPYKVDVSTALRKGWNTLQVRVTTPWVNRLIGDAQPGTAATLFSTGPTYAANAPLRRSGLLGPVTIEHYRPTP